VILLTPQPQPHNHTTPQPHNPTTPQPRNNNNNLTTPQPHHNNPTTPQPHNPTTPQSHKPTKPQSHKATNPPTNPQNDQPVEPCRQDKQMNGSIVATSQPGFVPFWTLRGSLSTLTSVSQISIVQVEMTLLLLQQTSFLGQMDEQKKQRRASAIEEHKVKIKAMEEQVAFLKAELAQMVAMQDG